jgi:hypothetical protein
MPTIISHTAVPLAIGLGLGPKGVSSRLLLVGLRRLFGQAGHAVFSSELRWVWLPASIALLALALSRRRRAL